MEPKAFSACCMSELPLKLQLNNGYFSNETYLLKCVDILIAELLPFGITVIAGGHKQPHSIAQSKALTNVTGE